MKASKIKYKNSMVLFEIDLWELALQKLEEVLIPGKPLDGKKTVWAISMQKKEKVW